MEISELKAVNPFIAVQLIGGAGLLLFLLIRTIYHFFVKKSLVVNGPTKDSKYAFYLDISGQWTADKTTRPIAIENPFRGLLITGSVGSGKTKSIIEPLIVQAVEKQFAGMLYDYESPILTNHLYSAFKKNESPVEAFFVNFEDLSRSHRLNPLDPNFLTSSAYAREYSHTILGNLASEFIHKPSFWTRSAEGLLAAAIWFLKDKHFKKCTLPHAVSLLLTSDIPLLLERLSESDEAAGMVASIQSGLASANQTAGVIATLQNALAALNTPSIFWVLSGSDLDLDLNSVTSPKFLCVANTPPLAATYGPVISLIFSAALKQMNQQGKQHSSVIIDELPTIYIPNLDRIPATARKNRIATILCVQDFSQMEDRYGDKKTEVITSVLANQMFGKTTNPKTADRISRLYGRDDKEYWTESRSQSGLKGSRSVSQSIQERANVKPQDIVNLETGQFYGSLVDSWINVFKVPFKEVTYDLEAMPSFATVSSDQIKTNFQTIRQEAFSIVQGNLDKPNEPNYDSVTISFGDD